MSASSPIFPPAGGSRGQIRLSGLLLLAATLIAYANSFGGPFIFDDKPAILENPTIHHLWPLTTVLSPPPIGSSVTGRPVVNFSLALNYAISGEAPGSYHAVNLLIHGLAGLALFGLVRRSLLQPVVTDRLRAAALPLALVVAGLWLLHPLQTESVTSIIQRTESLVGLFYLLTLYAFIRGVQSSRPGPWLTASVAACLVGMATKEVMVTAPLIVLALDRTFVAGTFHEAWRQRRSFYFGLGATWLLLAAIMVSSGGTRGEAAGFGLGVTPWTYALTQCRAIVLYLKLSVWPHPLVLDYGTDVVRHTSEVLPQAALIAGLGAGAIWAWARRPAIGFLGLAFLVILAPSSSVVPLVSQTIAEHRMYLPLAAVVALLVIAAYAKLGRGTWLVAAVIAVTFAAITFQRNRDYRTEEAIWTHTAMHAPGNTRAHVNLAECLINLGRPGDALEPAQTAVRLQPAYPEAQMNLGISLTQLGRPEEALPHSQEAVRLKPADDKAHSNLGATLFRLGRWEEAVTQFQESLRLAPKSPNATLVRNNLALALLQAGRLPEAIKQFQTVLQAEPDLVETHYSLAVALGLSDRLPEAAEQMQAVLRLQPDHAKAREALESIRAELGK